MTASAVVLAFHRGGEVVRRFFQAGGFSLLVLVIGLVAAIITAIKQEDLNAGFLVLGVALILCILDQVRLMGKPSAYVWGVFYLGVVVAGMLIAATGVLWIGGVAFLAATLLAFIVSLWAHRPARLA